MSLCCRVNLGHPNLTLYFFIYIVRYLHCQELTFNRSHHHQTIPSQFNRSFRTAWLRRTFCISEFFQIMTRPSDPQVTMPSWSKSRKP
uniref:Uncharacterized protein n=1 Tax=Arion vulgaris TaxID=1028688 RepID=A0A0B7BAM7_9EUPU